MGLFLDFQHAAFLLQKRSKKQRRMGKVHSNECKIAKNSKERQEEGLSNEPCIKTEEKNRRGKTRDLFRKIGNIKGIFCPKIGTIKDRNS